MFADDEAVSKSIRTNTSSVWKDDLVREPHFRSVLCLLKINHIFPPERYTHVFVNEIHALGYYLAPSYNVGSSLVLIEILFFSFQ